MRLKLYVLSSGELKENPVPASWTIKDLAKDGEVWLDIEDAGPEELRTFLAPLGLHPLLLDRCAGEKDSPGVISYEEEILLEIPAAFDPAGGDLVYLRLILRSPLMVTSDRVRCLPLTPL
jgi:Mg2+ and Co2+ transporter CorA